jgi:hypothetical protein
MYGLNSVGDWRELMVATMGARGDGPRKGLAG